MDGDKKAAATEAPVAWLYDYTDADGDCRTTASVRDPRVVYAHELHRVSNVRPLVEPAAPETQDEREALRAEVAKLRGWENDAEQKAGALQRKLNAAPAPVAQPSGEPVAVSAVATVERVSGDLRLNWLIEGGIHDLPPGSVLVVADSPITDDEGRGEVYTAAPAPVAQDAPLGAILNGRTHMDRLDGYPFECEAGPLHLCDDWVERRRCFEHLADWAQALPAAPAPVARPLTTPKDKPGATFVEGYGYVDTAAVRAIERAHGIDATGQEGRAE